MKGCPFCNGEVLVEQNFAKYGATIHAECQECGMVFEYTEKVEDLEIDYPGLGERRVYYNIKRRKNPPFMEVWEQRKGI